MTKTKLIEKLAELEHEQWEGWTRNAVDELVKDTKNGMDENKTARNVGKLHSKWFYNWKPYNELTETVKAKDRVFAVKVTQAVAEEILKHGRCEKMHEVDGKQFTCLDMVLRELDYHEDLEVKTRLQNINKLIDVIASMEGKAFFKNNGAGHNAYFTLKANNLYFTEEWQGKEIPINENSNCFKLELHHGSTLSQQIVDFGKFILTGKMQGLFTRYWGYTREQLKPIHDFAIEIGFTDQDYIDRIWEESK
jgi:hypothetical protein